MKKNQEDTLSFEEAMQQLQQIVSQLESGEVALETAVALYEQGNKLKVLCEQKLKDAKERIDRIILDENGNPKGTTPLQLMQEDR